VEEARKRIHLGVLLLLLLLLLLPRHLGGAAVGIWAGNGGAEAGRRR
jgi:hypothetical protein